MPGTSKSFWSPQASPSAGMKIEPSITAAMASTLPTAPTATDRSAKRALLTARRRRPSAGAGELPGVDRHQLVVAIAGVQRADLAAGQELGEALAVGDVDRERAGDPGVEAGGGGCRDVVARQAAGGEQIGEGRGARGLGAVDEVALDVGAESGGRGLAERLSGECLGYRGLVRLEAVVLDDQAHAVDQVASLSQPVGEGAELDLGTERVAGEEFAHRRAAGELAGAERCLHAVGAATSEGVELLVRVLGIAGRP
jgi:hypothetical protein